MRTRAVLAVLAIALTGAALFHVRTADAATRTWTGGEASNSNWTDPDNWNTGAPVAGDTLVFPQAAARKMNTNDLPANTVFESITFDGSGYVVDGNDLGTTNGILNRPPSGTNTLLLDIGGTGGITNESGRLVLDGDNTFDGAVEIDGGVLHAASDDALGSTIGSTTVAAGGTLLLSASVDIGAEAVDITGDGFNGFGALQSSGGTNRAGDVAIFGDTTIGVGNSTLIIGMLSGAGGPELTLLGGGKLQVDGSVFTGPIDVLEGNLTWNASSQVFVDVDKLGWLRGTGTVSTAHVIGGLIWPGSGNSPGILTVFNATTFSGGAFKVDLDGPTVGTGYGQLNTAGVTLTSNATLLDLDLTFQPLIGTVFTIINNTGGAVDGRFFNLPEGTTFTADGYAFRISYVGGTGNDVTLTVLRPVTADLRLAMTASPSPVAAGSLLTYSLVLTNLGPDAAASPRVTMGTPVGTTYESASGPANWVCSKPLTSASVSCTGPTFAAGATANFTFVFRVNNGATGLISGTAGVSSDTNDPFSANNAVNVLTPVGAGGGLGFKVFLPAVARD